MLKLTSISDHSDWLQQLVIPISERWYYHRNRVEFGKQPLNISMFVPAKFVDGEWVVLEKPEPYYVSQGFDDCPEAVFNEIDYLEYETAKSNVLFKAVEIKAHYDSDDEYAGTLIGDIFTQNKNHTWSNYSNYKTIENLVKLQPTLTEKAEKQIGI